MAVPARQELIARTNALAERVEARRRASLAVELDDLGDLLESLRAWFDDVGKMLDEREPLEDLIGQPGAQPGLRTRAHETRSLIDQMIASRELAVAALKITSSPTDALERWTVATIAALRSVLEMEPVDLDESIREIRNYFDSVFELLADREVRQRLGLDGIAPEDLVAKYELADFLARLTQTK